VPAAVYGRGAGHNRPAGVGEFSLRESAQGGVFNEGEEPLALNPDYTFQNFVTGPCNRLAHAACIAVAEQPGQTYNPLFIHGGVGLGKTHLLQAVSQQVLERQPDARILYLSCDSFINQFINAIESGEMNQFRYRYRHVDMLVVDDIHFLAGRDRTQEEFFHTFNTLYQQHKQIILSADCPPNEIPELEERLVSRFNWGLVARIDRPCYETRVAIVQKKARMRGLSLPDDVVCYIAARIESNTRELEGAITKMQGMSSLQDGRIDLELAKAALGDSAAPEQRPHHHPADFRCRHQVLQRPPHRPSEQEAEQEHHVPATVVHVSGPPTHPLFAGGNRRLFRRARPHDRAPRRAHRRGRNQEGSCHR
jgi:chromosomal replication initiator protein DnaA